MGRGQNQLLLSSTSCHRPHCFLPSRRPHGPMAPCLGLAGLATCGKAMLRDEAKAVVVAPDVPVGRTGGGFASRRYGAGRAPRASGVGPCDARIQAARLPSQTRLSARHVRACSMPQLIASLEGGAPSWLQGEVCNGSLHEKRKLQRKSAQEEEVRRSMVTEGAIPLNANVSRHVGGLATPSTCAPL